MKKSTLITIAIFLVSLSIIVAGIKFFGGEEINKKIGLNNIIKNQQGGKFDSKVGFEEIYANMFNQFEANVTKINEYQQILNKEENYNLGIDFDVKQIIGEGNGKINIIAKSLSSIPQDFSGMQDFNKLKYDGSFILDGNIKADAQGQNFDIVFSGNMLLKMLNGKIFSQINSLNAESSNPAVKMFTMGIQNFMQKWILITQMPDLSQLGMEEQMLSQQEIIEITKEIILVIKQNNIFKILEEKVENNSKIFKITIDNEKIITIIDQIAKLESIKKLTEGAEFTQEDKDEIKKELEKIDMILVISAKNNTNYDINIEKLNINNIVNITGIIKNNSGELLINSPNDNQKLQVKYTVDNNNYKVLVDMLMGELKLFGIESDFTVKSENNNYNFDGKINVNGNGFTVNTDIKYDAKPASGINIEEPTDYQKLDDITKGLFGNMGEIDDAGAGSMENFSGNIEEGNFDFNDEEGIDYETEITPEMIEQYNNMSPEELQKFIEENTVGQ